MKLFAVRLVGIIWAAWALCSCAPQARLVPYSEAALIPYRGTGSGTVAGRAFTILRDKTVQVAANSTLGLMPDTAYTEEIEDRVFTKGQKLVPPDSRFTKYVRFTTTDGDGNFTFNHVKAGDYFVFCDLAFNYEEDETNDDGSTTEETITDTQWIYAPITVTSGETTNVNEWNQGK
jgi:hypothetical protein